jgi:Protein of unknown function (DUF3263)
MTPLYFAGGASIVESAPAARGLRDDTDDTVDTEDTEDTARTADGRDSSDGLGRRDREILTFERQWWKYAGAKEQAIRELFDMSATRYYQVLNALIDTPAALKADPMLVKRLRRLRATRQRQRSARRLGIEV